jgi:hypothetical protein
MADGISKTQLVLLRGSLRTLVLFAPLYVLVSVLRWTSHETFSWDARLGDAQSLDGRLPLAPGATATWEGQAQIHLDDPSVLVWVAALVPTTIVGLSVSVVAFLLLGILYETHAGQPFFDSSSRRLRWVSRVIAVTAVTAPVAWSIANVEIAEEALPSRNVPGDVDLSQMLTWLLVALVVRVIAEAFRIGTELRRDTEGLV